VRGWDRCSEGVRNVVIALAAAAASACAGDASRHAVAEPRVDTLNGVLHIRNLPEGAWAGEERWTVEEIMRLGARDSPTEELFSGPLLTTATGPDGSIYVLDYDAGSISVFSAEGAFVRRIGRRGRGPGEFMAPVGLSWDAFDRLWVADGAGRLTVFSRDGEYIRTQRRPVQSDARRQHPLIYLPDGSLLDEGGWPFVNFVKVDTADRAVDTVAVMEQPPISEAARGIRLTPGSDIQKVSHQYVNRRRWTLAPDSTLWIVDTGELRLVQRELDGDTIRVIHTSHRPSTLSASEERMIDHALAGAGLDRTDIDIARPVVQQILVMDDGHVLVQIESDIGEDGRLFDVFEPDGRYLGVLDFGFAPARLGVTTLRGDTILAPTLGAFDVPYVVKAVIRRGEVTEHG
jgi:6-bladed beta-propeller